MVEMGETQAIIPASEVYSEHNDTDDGIPEEEEDTGSLNSSDAEYELSDVSDE